MPCASQNDWWFWTHAEQAEETEGEALQTRPRVLQKEQGVVIVEADRRIAERRSSRSAALTLDFGFVFFTRLDILSAGRHGGAMQEEKSQHSQVWLLAVFETGLGLSGRKSSRRGIVSRIDHMGRPAGLQAQRGAQCQLIV